jgi:hypothetical protein
MGKRDANWQSSPHARAKRRFGPGVIAESGDSR